MVEKVCGMDRSSDSYNRFYVVEIKGFVVTANSRSAITPVLHHSRVVRDSMGHFLGFLQLYM